MTHNKKFFNEMKDNPHLDIRYGKKNLSNETIHSKLKMLLKETVQIFDLVHIPCIIMHGSLIGWYFGKQMLPWDDDIDIVILDEHREKLKTLHQYQNNKILIEVNPVIDTIHRDLISLKLELYVKILVFLLILLIYLKEIYLK